MMKSDEIRNESYHQVVSFTRSRELGWAGYNMEHICVAALAHGLHPALSGQYVRVEVFRKATELADDAIALLDALQEPARYPVGFMRNLFLRLAALEAILQTASAMAEKEKNDG